MSTGGFGVAIVGTGRIVKTHVRALRDIRAFNIIGIYGRDGERTDKIASDTGLKAFGSFDEVLSDPTIHVVDIATASDMHAYYGMEAAERGKNIIMEKPIDTSVEKALELVQLSRQRGTILGVVYQHRFDEIVVLLKDLITKDSFGRLISGRVLWRQKRDALYYKNAVSKGKGVLINNGIHYVDMILYLLGDVLPHSFRGVLKKTRPEFKVEDYASISIEFDNSFLFTMDLQTNIKKSLPTLIEINGEKGSVVFWGDKIRFVSLDLSWSKSLMSRRFLKLHLAKKCKSSFKYGSGTHKDVFENYLGALVGKNTVSVDGETASLSLRIVSELYKCGTIKK